MNRPEHAGASGAVEEGVPFFIDRQLADRCRRGDHYFLGGPWLKGTWEQCNHAGVVSPGEVGKLRKELGLNGDRLIENSGDREH